MSAFEIRVDFHGLIGLVPAGDGRFLLPLPDLARGTEPQPPERLPRRVPPHLACVVVPREHRVPQPPPDPPCRPPRSILEFQRQFEGEEVQQIFRFGRERLTIRFSGAGAGASGFPSELDPERHRRPSDPGAPPASDLAWVPSLTRTGIDGADQFDGQLLAADFVPATDDFNRLVGTVLLDSGTLSSSGVVLDSDDKAAVFDFIPWADPNRTEFSQAMFEHMVWKASATGDGLELVFTRGEGDDRLQRCLPLRPQGGRIDLAVYNLEVEDILGLGFGTDPPGVDTDPDFAISYWMSQAWNSLGKGMAVIPRSAALGPGGSGEACKVGRYTGIS